MNPGTAQAPPSSLRVIAQRLRDGRLARLVASYGEYHVSVRRALLLALTLLWCLYWQYLAGPSHSRTVLAREAQLLRPWAELFFMLGLAWMGAVRLRVVRTTELADGIGAAVNVLGIGVLLGLAWNLCISMITLLPLATIMVGTRFGRGMFFGFMAGSVVVLGFAAPPHYWVDRPAFIPFALVLLVGLPLTVYRLLGTISGISQSALRSRDAQSRFIATMSHELRTPLNTVVHAASLIDTAALEASDRQLMHALRANATALLQRVNDVLDVAAIDAGRLHFAREPFLVANVLGQVRDVVGPLAHQRGVRLRTVQGRGLDDAMLGDPGRIAQVLINLGTNAVKFSPAGADVSIELRLADNGLVQPRLLCTVTDTGSGVPDEMKTRIFEPFYQTSDGLVRRHDGTGLGLHIVRSICQQLGGRVAVGDNPGGGSIFTAALPLERAAPEQAVTEPLDTVSALDAHRARVPAITCLVVDDNRSSRDTLGHLLRRAGHRVIFAGSGEEGLQAMEGPHRPQLALLDMHMPDLSGLDVLARYRQRHPHDGMAIVMLSADSDPEAIEQALATGAAAYLTKPVSIERLLGLLRQVGTRAPGLPASAAPPAVAATPAALDPSARPTESSLALICRIASPEQRRTYLQSWQSELQHDNEELLAALRAHDRTAVAARLHRLQNAFLVMGRSQGVLLCTQLRESIRGERGLEPALGALQAELQATAMMLRELLAETPLSRKDTTASARPA
ncbi:MAG TPA: ATP-binding protein [Frateuria sp.]|uniref:ATP-binding protein n=1 Tax=Frateuria sp. TaxID=2211372 RepID=UPI002D80187C|nr:ATP-binding protein [Frateuria sp.]HET6805130.1 ATP-binding protein [Frateuria sp.]